MPRKANKTTAKQKYKNKFGVWPSERGLNSKLKLKKPEEEKVKPTNIVKQADITKQLEKEWAENPVRQRMAQERKEKLANREKWLTKKSKKK